MRIDGRLRLHESPASTSLTASHSFRRFSLPTIRILCPGTHSNDGHKMCSTTLSPDSNISTVFPLNSRVFVFILFISPPKYQNEKAGCRTDPLSNQGIMFESFSIAPKSDTIRQPIRVKPSAFVLKTGKDHSLTLLMSGKASRNYKKKRWGGQKIKKQSRRRLCPLQYMFSYCAILGSNLLSSPLRRSLPLLRSGI